MTSNLEAFGLPEMLRCGRGIRRAAEGAVTMEDALGRVSRFLYEELRSSSDDRACALVRCYKTHPFGQLPSAQRAFATTLMGEAKPDPSMPCLTLLATIGDNPMWNDIRRSKGHRAIPLPSPDIVGKAPMIAQLIKQFGLDLAAVTAPASADIARKLEGKTYGVFHVEEALGSPFIPAQDFVRRYNIESVVGCGGHIRADLFAVILFSKVRVDAEAAERFRTLALDVKATLFPLEDAVFNARH